MKRLFILVLLPWVWSCSTSETPDAPPVTVAESNETSDVSAEIAWAAKVKGLLETAIESKLGLRNRVEATAPDKVIRIVFLQLPPRSVPKEMPNGEIKNVLNANGAPSRVKLQIRDILRDLRLEVTGFEMYNGKLHPNKPTPFQ
jgi:hypothetical protein